MNVENPIKIGFLDKETEQRLNDVLAPWTRAWEKFELTVDVLSVKPGDIQSDSLTVKAVLRAQRVKR